MKPTTRALALAVTALALCGLASTVTAADATPARSATRSVQTPPRPFLHLQGHRVKRSPGKLIGHGYLGTKGHLGCQVFYHPNGNPTLTRIPISKTLDTDAEQFYFKLHHLTLTKTYYVKLRCGSPLRTVAADSAHPDQAFRQPSLTAQGGNVFSPGRIWRNSIRLYGNVRHLGHLHCSLWFRTSADPKLVPLYPHESSFDRDDEDFEFTRHGLNLKEKYFFKLRCGTPLRTVAADSAYPTQPVGSK